MDTSNNTSNMSATVNTIPTTKISSPIPKKAPPKLPRNVVELSKQPGWDPRKFFALPQPKPLAYKSISNGKLDQDGRDAADMTQPPPAPVAEVESKPGNSDKSKVVNGKGAKSDKGNTGGNIYDTNNGPGPSNSQRASANISPVEITAPEIWFKRNNKNQRDVIISSSGVTRNQTRLIRTHLRDGNSFVKAENFSKPGYNLAAHLKSMDTAEKELFFRDACIEIQIMLKTPAEEKREEQERARLGEEYVEGKSVVDILESLGPKFAANAQKLTVSIIFPATSNVNTSGRTITQSDLFKSIPSYKSRGKRATPIDPYSPNYQSLLELCEWLKTCPNISFLTFLLHTPPVPAGQKLIKLWHVYHTTAFYSLPFEDWNIKFIPQGAPSEVHSIKVGSWAVKQCDLERARMLDPEREEELRKEAVRKDNKEHFSQVTVRYCATRKQ